LLKRVEAEKTFHPLCREKFLKEKLQKQAKNQLSDFSPRLLCSLAEARSNS
jgi:hypothetical protein